MKKSAALKMALTIISDKRNENRYCMTHIRDYTSMEVVADYYDAVDVVNSAYAEALKEENEATCDENEKEGQGR